MIVLETIAVMMGMAVIYDRGGDHGHDGARRVEERWLDIENAIEIEGVAAEHLIDVDLRALGAVQPRVRIESSDPCFQLS